MHILHIDLGGEMRGGQHQVLLLLKTLRNAGHSFTLLAREESPLFEAALRLHFHVEAASLLRLRGLSTSHDIVHVHDARAHSWAALASRRPFVVARRVAFPVSRSPLSRWKYRRAARFLAVSKFVSARLQDAGVPPSKIDVVYDSVESPSSFEGWRSNGPVVALALTDPKKGRDLIERASQISRIPITFSSDITKDLEHASAFVYISRSEGFGSAVLVAMSMGVPVIASAVDGLLEVFEDGISGLAVKNDPASIAQALTHVRSNPELASLLIANGRIRVETLFDPSSLMLHTLSSYRRALAL